MPTLTEHLLVKAMDPNLPRQHKYNYLTNTISEEVKELRTNRDWGKYKPDPRQLREDWRRHIRFQRYGKMLERARRNMYRKHGIKLETGYEKE